MIANINDITERIIERSRPTRERYLARIDEAHKAHEVNRAALGCSNLAHVMAAESSEDGSQCEQARKHDRAEHVLLLVPICSTSPDDNLKLTEVQ